VSTVEYEITIPDTVRELLELAGDHPVELAVEPRTNKRPIAWGTTLLPSRPDTGETTHHRVVCPVTAPGTCDRFSVYADGELLTDEGHWDQGPCVVAPYDEIHVNLKVTW